MDFKKKLCEFIIGNYCRENNKIETELTRKDIYNQTTLGIAMEYLGLTDGWLEEDFDYLSIRAGLINTYIDYNNNVFNLTLRDILNI